MEKKVYDFTFYGENYKVSLEFSKYTNNDSLALSLIDESEENKGELFGVATVNLDNSDMLPSDMAALDENNLQGIGRFLEKNRIAEPTGVYLNSGWCRYPVYHFLVTE